ncbi:MAG: rRNA maturation RNase YbeY [Candidatus Ratteibacteria bacterium]
MKRITGINRKRVHLINLQRKVQINFNDLTKAVALLEEKIGDRLRKINIVIVSDNKIKQLNKKFLKKNYPTDVLAFRLGKTGEIIISAERAKIQASEMKHKLEDELFYLIVHGILHLQGYDDTDAHSYNEMKKKQDSICAKISGKLHAKR